MIIQNIIIFILFAAAVFYLGRLFYMQFFSKKNAGCGGNCSCSAVDMERIERQIKESMLPGPESKKVLNKNKDCH